MASLIAATAAIALGVSVYLTWVTWQSGTVGGCTAESLFDCDEVLATRWSKWFGLPVSLLGALTYLALLGLSWPAATRPAGLAVAGLFALAMVAAGAAVWFVGLQAIELQSFCFYCLTVHTCGLVVGVAAFFMFIDTNETSDSEPMQSLFGVAAVEPDDRYVDATGSVSGLRVIAAIAISAGGLLALMGGQLLSKPAEMMAMEEFDFAPLPNQSLEPQTSTTQSSMNQLSTGQSTTGLANHDEQSQRDLASAAEPSTDDNAWLEQESEYSLEPVPLAEQPPETIGSLFGSGPRRITFRALSEPVEVASMPLLGSIDAEHVMVEMMDYTCKHCRNLHPHIRAAVERYGGQLGVVIHHVPLSKQCNPYVLKDYPGKKYACDYAQLAIGVWTLAPAKFPEFHDWLLESKKPPNVSKARSRAMSLVGDEVLRNKRIKAEITKRLAKQSADLKRLKVGLPVLLSTEGALRGVPEESQKLFDYLESTLGVEPRQTAN